MVSCGDPILTVRYARNHAAAYQVCIAVLTSLGTAIN